MRNSIMELAAETQQEIEIMVKDVKGSMTSNGAPYQRLSVQDKEGNMATFLRFDEPVDVNGPAVCRMLVEASTYNNKPSYKVLRSEILPDADLTCFYPKAEIDERSGFAEINAYYKRIRHPGYRKLVGNVLTKDAVKFRTKPLTAAGAFSRQCGIMEATLALLRMADHAVAIFGLNADLMYAAGLLYYVGNIDLVSDGYAPTEDDLLAGEGNAAVRRLLEVEMALRADGMTEEMLPKRDVNVLLHMLTSRYGGVKSAVPESVALRDLGHMLKRTEEAKQLVKGAVPGTVVCSQGSQFLRL